MITTRADFEEGTAFELYVLETLRPAIDQHQGAYLDLRGSANIAAVSISITENISGDAVNRVKDKLAPLLFGAGWKVLDLLLEFSLNTAGLVPVRGDWAIAEKQGHASRSGGNRAVLGCSEPVWKALLLVYANTVEHRHCLVHRTAQVNADTGVMEGVDRNKQRLRPLTLEEQTALAKVAALAARGVISGGIDPRSEGHLKYQLDQLTGHTGVAPFGTGGPSAPVDILIALKKEGGTFVLDMTGVLEKARKTFQTVAYFNVVVDVPDGSGRKLFGYAENCAPGRSPIDLAAPPPWLEYR